MVIANPRADVRPSALPVPYAPPASSGNSLAAPAPVTWLSPRPAPRAELAAAMETVALHGLGGSAAAVLVALWSWSSVDGLAWPCAESIARRSSRSRRTVFRALAALEEAGLVARQRPSLRARRRFRESNTYRLAPVAALPQVPRAESPCPPRRVPPSPSASSSRSPAMRLTAVEPMRVEPVALPPSPSPAAPHQVTPWRSKGPTPNQKENTRTGAQARATPAPPVDRLGPPAVAQSVPEVTPTKITSAEPSSPEALPSPRRTRAERAAANRAAWAARTRPASTAARVPAPRRAPPYRAPVERVPDTGPALAALREWQATLPTVGRETDRESATPAPVPGVRRPDLAQRAPVALSGLLEAFARAQGQPHAGPHEGSHRMGNGPDSPPQSPRRRPEAPSGPRVEARPPSLWSTLPHR